MVPLQYSDLEELSEELQPLAEQPEPLHTGGRVKALAALCLVGSAAAVAHHYRAAAPLAVSDTDIAERAQGLFFGDVVIHDIDGKPLADPEALWVESNLSQYIVAPPGDMVSASEIGHWLFAQAETQTNMSNTELTVAEASAWRDRFVAEVIGMENSNKGELEDFLERAAQKLEDTKPIMTHALADRFNNNTKLQFKVEMREWMLDESIATSRTRLMKSAWNPPDDGRLFYNDLSSGTIFPTKDLPKEFTIGDKWPACKEVVERVFDQSRCGSGWSFGAVGAMDSRICIETKGSFVGPTASLSRGWGASCAQDPSPFGNDGCHGGWPEWVYDAAAINAGIPSTNCAPYFAGPDSSSEWHTGDPPAQCPLKCDSRFPRELTADLFNPIGMNLYRLLARPSESGLWQIKANIYHEGPLPIAITVHRAFFAYASGAYEQGCSEATAQPNHVVQIVGYGKDLGKYNFHAVNSWGEQWGAKGRFNTSVCMVRYAVFPGSTSEAAANHYPVPVPAWGT